MPYRHRLLAPGVPRTARSRWPVIEAGPRGGSRTGAHWLCRAGCLRRCGSTPLSIEADRLPPRAPVCIQPLLTIANCVGSLLVAATVPARPAQAPLIVFATVYSVLR